MMKSSLRLSAWMLAVAMMFALSSPAYAAAGCSFQTRGGLRLVFGTLDPSVATDMPASFVVGTAGSDQWGSCAKTTMSMSATSLNGGVMTNGTGGSIQYSVTLPANATTGAGNGYLTFALNAVVLGMHYIDAPAGNYTDTLTIMVSP